MQRNKNNSMNVVRLTLGYAIAFSSPFLTVSFLLEGPTDEYIPVPLSNLLVRGKGKVLKRWQGKFLTISIPAGTHNPIPTIRDLLSISGTSVPKETLESLLTGGKFPLYRYPG